MEKKSNKTKIIIIAIVAVIILGVIGALVVPRFIGEKIYDDPIVNLMQQVEYDGEADYDNDGLTNDQEKEHGTDILLADTDGDGLGDLYEMEESETDPLKFDTDGDTLSDYVELMAGLDPLKDSTDGTPDKDRVFEETLSKNNITVKLNGSATIYDVYVGDFEVTGLLNTPGVMSQAIEFYAANNQEAEAQFKYNKTEIENKGGNIENLAIYSFKEDGSFEKVEGSAVDTDKNVVTATLKNSSKYLLCDSKMIGQDYKTSIMLLIDNSGSMYPADMCEGSEENDVNFKRLDMAKSIITNINENVEYGLARFTGTYFGMSPIGSSNEDLFTQIESIRTIEETFNGTYIATSIMSAADNFTADYNGNRKFIIILTDGETTEGSGWFGIFDYNENDAIDKCKKKNISVITIALGNHVDSAYLQKISSQTGGAYIYANNDSALTEVYNSILTQLVYSTEDTNGDDKVDSYVMADSGFDMSKDAFSFENFDSWIPGDKTSGGFCYGMALIAQTFYNGNVNLDGDAYDAKFQNLRHNESFSFCGYDITECLEGIKNLRDYKNDTLSKYQEYWSIPSKEKYTLKDGVLKLNDEILKQYNNKYFKKHTISCKEGKWGNDTYTKYEVLILDVKGYIESGEKNLDMEMVCALYWSWGIQMSTQDGIQLIDYSLGKVNEDGFMKVVERINSGVPLIVSYQLTNSGHSINAMRILRDINNPQVFYLECYDNNDSQNPYYFKIESKDMGWWDGTSIENWGKNYSVKSYMMKNGKWEATGLDLQEVIVP